MPNTQLIQLKIEFNGKLSSFGFSKFIAITGRWAMTRTNHQSHIPISESWRSKWTVKFGRFHIHISLWIVSAYGGVRRCWHMFVCCFSRTRSNGALAHSCHLRKHHIQRWKCVDKYIDRSPEKKPMLRLPAHSVQIIEQIILSTHSPSMQATFVE